MLTTELPSLPCSDVLSLYSIIIKYIGSNGYFHLLSGWPHNKLLEKTLYLQVIDYDRFSRDDPIGEIYVPLNEVDLSQSPLMWKFLGPCKDSRVSIK